MPDIEIEIDGKSLKVKPNSMLIQAADEAGIYIPRFCYHKHLSIAANCRMCLVDVEKVPKPLPACATPVTPGMKVFTRSEKALSAQKAVMEFLLINHPLDCPICDQGGECELQDLSMGYGAGDSYYHEGKRAVKDEDLGPLIATDMTRCIQCTRCVRFGEEVAGLRELGATGRGENMTISTYVGQTIHSEISGNIIDLCPVGALTSKPFRFTARAWELEQHASIAPHDCVGSNIHVHTRSGKVMRVVPKENVNMNETWISDRDRYSYEGLYHADRLTEPMVRHNQEWKTVDWQTAIDYAATHIKRIIEHSGADALGALVSPHATLEEFYLLQKMVRQLGSPHIDHRLRQVDFKDQMSFPLFPGLSGQIADLETADGIVLIGSCIQKEQPLLALRVRKAWLKNATVCAVNMMDYRFHFNLTAKKISAPHHFVKSLAGIVKAISDQYPDLNDIRVTDTDRAFADALLKAKQLKIILGADALNHPESSRIRLLANRIAEKTKGEISILTEGCNSAGAWIAGAIPHRLPGGAKVNKLGLDAEAMCRNPRKAYLLFNVEPELDYANPPLIEDALKNAECIVSFSVFKNPLIQKYGQVILPIASFTETSGTYVNTAGVWQTFRGVAERVGESRPAWKIVRVLSHFLNLTGFDYPGTDAILDELKAVNIAVAKETAAHTIEFNTSETRLSRVGAIPLYAGDSIVRRAPSLQRTQTIIEEEVTALRIHPETAERFNVHHCKEVIVKQSEQQVTLPIVMDHRVPIDAAYIAGGIMQAAKLSELFGSIEIEGAKE